MTILVVGDDVLDATKHVSAHDHNHQVELECNCVPSQLFDDQEDDIQQDDGDITYPESSIFYGHIWICPIKYFCDAQIKHAVNEAPIQVMVVVPEQLLLVKNRWFGRVQHFLFV